MKYLICILSLIPMLSFGQQTIIGDLDVTGGITRDGGFEVVTDALTPGGPMYPNYVIIEPEIYYVSESLDVVQETIVDAIVNVSTGSNNVKHYRLLTSYIRKESEATEVEYESLDESIATVDENGNVDWVSAGTGEIQVTLADFQRTVSLDMSAPALIVRTNIWNGTVGSLRKALTDPIDNALAADPGAGVDDLFDAGENNLFSTIDWSAHTYVRNPSCWAYAATGGTDPWTALAVWTTGKSSTAIGQAIRGTLISPDLITFSWHNRPSPGAEFKWLGTDNQIYTRTLTATKRVYADSGIGKLSSPLPAEVVPAKILEGNPSKYFGFLKTGVVHSQDGTPAEFYEVPGIQTNRNLEVGIQTVDLFEIVNGSPLGFSYWSDERGYAVPLEQGDSGSPMLWVLDGELIVLWTWYTTITGTIKYADGVMASAVQELDGTMPTAVDLSGYPIFNEAPSPE